MQVYSPESTDHKYLESYISSQYLHLLSGHRIVRNKGVTYHPLELL